MALYIHSVLNINTTTFWVSLKKMWIVFLLFFGGLYYPFYFVKNQIIKGHMNLEIKS